MAITDISDQMKFFLCIYLRPLIVPPKERLFIERYEFSADKEQLMHGEVHEIRCIQTDDVQSDMEIELLKNNETLQLEMKHLN